MATSSEPLYNDIWKHIKAKHGCKIAAHPALHKRIIHAVINKKYYDFSYKMDLQEKKKSSKLTYIRTASQIIFKLTIYTQLGDITEGDI